MSDKAELKKLKKEAQLAELASAPLIGERFPTTYSWGYRLLQAVCSLEERVRILEEKVNVTFDGLLLTKIRTITSDAVIQATTTQEVTADSVILATTEQNITSDTTVE